MKKIRLLLLLALWPLLSVGQVISTYPQGKKNVTQNFNYVAIPTPPSFADPVTITTSVGSSLESGELSGKTDVLVSNPFAERLRPNGLSGTVGTPYRFKSVSDATYSIVGGDILTTSQQAIGTLNAADYHEWHHLHIKGDSDPAVTGISGFAAASSTGGSHFKWSDLVVEDVEFAGFLVNEGTSGEKYTSLDIQFARVFGHQEEGEGLYFGNTSKTVWSDLDYLYVRHIFITDKGRDGMQFNNVLDLDVANVTIYDVGKVNTSSQRSLVQVQNSQGDIADGLFWGAPAFGTISSHGITFTNCYFYVSGGTTERGFIGRLETDYAAPIGTLGLPINFVNCHFGSSVPLNEAWNIVEDRVNITFTNCTKDSNLTNLYLDNRADKITYTLSHTGTTTAASVTPTFMSLSPTDYYTHGKLTNWYLFSRGLGYLTP